MYNRALTPGRVHAETAIEQIESDRIQILEEKLMKRSFTLGAAAVLAIVVTGAACRKDPPVTQPAPAPAAAKPPETRPATPPPPPPPPAAAAPAPTEEEIFAKMTLDELNAKGVLADVLFGFDSTELTPEA